MVLSRSAAVRATTAASAGRRTSSNRTQFIEGQRSTLAAYDASSWSAAKREDLSACCSCCCPRCCSRGRLLCHSTDRFVERCCPYCNSGCPYAAIAATLPLRPCAAAAFVQGRRCVCFLCSRVCTPIAVPAALIALAPLTLLVDDRSNIQLLKMCLCCGQPSDMQNPVPARPALPGSSAT